jgi:hypothetical protein
MNVSRFDAAFALVRAAAKPSRMGALLLGTALVLATSSCEDENPVTPPAGPESSSVDIGSDYGDRVFFRLSDGSEVARYDRGIADLYVSASELRINTSALARVWMTGSTDFAGTTDTTGVSWDWDRAPFNESDLILRNWNVGDVVVLDRGVDPEGNPLGVVKLLLESRDASGATIQWAGLSDPAGATLVVPVDADRRFVGASFAGAGGVVEVEPPASDWDMVFGTYTETFELAEPVSYTVTGVLGQRGRTSVALDTIIGFANLSLDDAMTLPYTEDEDAVGYDWKTLDFSTFLFDVDTSKVYVIQVGGDGTYKLRFTDFYSPTGTRGVPSFQYQRLD